MSLFSFILLRTVPTAKAADTNITDGITVDSTLDTPDATINGECNDGAGNCTLRAAIQEANANPDASTIEFNITGTADFTNDGEDGYTIVPQSALPNINEQLTINGYSQPGAQANTAVAPQPLNGRLLIEIDGNAQNSRIIHFQAGSDGSQLKGLILNQSESGAVAIYNSSDVSIQGSYVGTDPTGLIARPTGSDDVNSSTAIDVGDMAPLVTDTQTVGTLIGGTNPEDRNIFSGNYGGAFGIAGVDSEFYGNYIGLGADGLTTLSNSYGAGVTTGALTIDYADGVQIGNGQSNGMNIISGNARGIQPDYSTDITIIGNRFGTDYSGSLPRPNLRNGISIGLETTNVRIGGPNNGDGNLIAYNISSGIGTWYSGSGDQVSDVVIENNTIQDTAGAGISIEGSFDVSIRNNTVRDNSDAGIRVVGTSAAASNNVITSNIIDGNGGGGVALVGLASNNIVGGSNPNDANEIRNNGAAGIFVISMNTPGPILAPSNNSFTGNSITGTVAGSTFGLSLPGIGIDAAEIELDGNFTPTGILEEGVTLNDATDSDAGPNNYMNFPVINSATQNGTNVAVNLDLDAADTTDPDGLYRVELFANNAAHPSGHGEGQTFLGYAMVANGTDQEIDFTVPSGTNLTGKVLSATTTAMNSATDSDLGSTSEFSAGVTPVVASVDSPDDDSGSSTNNSSGSLADTGQNALLTIAIASLLMLSAGTILSRRPH